MLFTYTSARLRRPTSTTTIQEQTRDEQVRGRVTSWVGAANACMTQLRHHVGSRTAWDCAANTSCRGNKAKSNPKESLKHLQRVFSVLCLLCTITTQLCTALQC
jgi:hypothetical protein